MLLVDTLLSSASAACGFVREGVLRESEKLPDGAFYDLVVYAMLRREWEALKQNT